MRFSYTPGFILLAFILLLSVHSIAQIGNGGTVKGQIFNDASRQPVPGISITVAGSDRFARSGVDGSFLVSGVPSGNQLIIVSGEGILTDTINVTVTEGNTTDLGNVPVVFSDQSAIDKGDIPTITLDDNSGQEDENASAASQSSSGFYVANQDPFLFTAAVVFGPYRFRPRGYDNSDVTINGIPLEDLETGFASFSLIGGLNDVMRNRTITYGLMPSEYSFGSVKGSTYMNATAADQRKGTSVSYQLSNGNIRNRVMATHSSGVNKNGWAYSVSGSRRWADEGYIPGTFYDAYSFYGAVSKVTKKGQLNLTAFGAPQKRGRATSEIGEVFDMLDNHYYNAAWGYQNGKKRSALVNDVFQPQVIANYTYKPSDRLRWNTALGIDAGHFRRSNIDFYNGYNPNPTYYRNLPYYYNVGVTNPNPAAADALREMYRSNPDLLQVQWDNLYNANYINKQTINDVNGIAGNNVTGNRSIYVLRDEVDDKRKISFTSNFTYAVNDEFTIDGGAEVVQQRDHYYKEVTDLLGGDFFVNYNQFAALQNPGQPSYVQNDLNNPNRLVRKGDKYGYDYKLNALNTVVWGQGLYNTDQFDFFVAGEFARIAYSREGLMRNGLFPDNSFGKGTTKSFTTGKVKGGVTYKLNAKNAVYVNAGYFADAPKIDFTFISARTRDYSLNGIAPYNTATMEAGYTLRMAKVNFRLTGYVADVTGNTLIKRFWNDDPDFQSFVNYVMQNVNTRSIGTEFVATAPITSRLTATVVAAIGQSFYTNRPLVSIYQDNIPANTPIVREVYIKNLYLGVGPQSIYSLALKYAANRNWYFNLDVNFMDRNYVEVNPDRRTQLAGDLVDSNSKRWNDIYLQERLPSAFVLNGSIGKSTDISKYYKGFHKRTTLNVNLGINNLLNNQDIKLNGFEQLRYDFSNQNPYKFPNKYNYAFGLNYHLTIGLRF
jgi:hypothetical protein